MIEPNYIRAHKYSSRHRDSLLASELCGCFYGLRLFQASEIKNWIDGGNTALCPKCGVDSVIGSQSGFPITIEFLNAMKMHWFGENSFTVAQSVIGSSESYVKGSQLPLRFAWSPSTGMVRATYRVEVESYEPRGDRFQCQLLELVEVNEIYLNSTGRRNP